VRSRGDSVLGSRRVGGVAAPGTAGLLPIISCSAPSLPHFLPPAIIGWRGCICKWKSVISLFCLLGTPTLFSTLFRRLFAFGFLAAFGFSLP
jgi:hypothetical protein